MIFQRYSNALTMASAFRKLFKSTDRLSDERRKKNRGSPSRQFAARLLGQYESPRLSRRDSKVSPAEGGPPETSKKSSKVDAVLSESVMRHNQAVRTRRLMKEYQEITRSMKNVDKPPYTVELVDDNLYDWNIRLYQIDPESDFYRDMQETRTHCVLINMNFPDNFPFSPPFMRVISPHIEKGFVMEGGAICMELLTPRGWASAYTVEAVIMQFAASLIKGQGRIARKCKSGKEFNRKSAEASFRSLVKTHEKYGWVTPPLADG